MGTRDRRKPHSLSVLITSPVISLIFIWWVRAASLRMTTQGGDGTGIQSGPLNQLVIDKYVQRESNRNQWLPPFSKKRGQTPELGLLALSVVCAKKLSTNLTLICRRTHPSSRVFITHLLHNELCTCLSQILEIEGSGELSKHSQLLVSVSVLFGHFLPVRTATAKLTRKSIRVSTLPWHFGRASRSSSRLISQAHHLCKSNLIDELNGKFCCHQDIAF
jgi:hypothetical protein